MKIAQCGSCKADVIWTLTERGGTMPMDAYTIVGKGEFVIDESTNPPTCRYVKEADRTPGTKLYVSHFATCPDRVQWRGVKKK